MPAADLLAASHHCGAGPASKCLFTSHQPEPGTPQQPAQLARQVEIRIAEWLS
jgi:hypothetical protein